MLHHNPVPETLCFFHRLLRQTAIFLKHHIVFLFVILSDYYKQRLKGALIIFIALICGGILIVILPSYTILILSFRRKLHAHDILFTITSCDVSLSRTRRLFLLIFNIVAHMVVIIHITSPFCFSTLYAFRDTLLQI